MVIQYRGGKEEERQMEGVCRFYWPYPSMSRMNFLDAFQGYHQIALAAEEQE